MLKKQYLALNVVLFFSLIYPDFSTNVKIGYDSNILKYSDNENPISSNLIQLGSLYNRKFNIFKRKTRFSVNLKNTFYKLSKKSNYSYGFKFKQPLGNYRYISFNYTYIDNIYLREYVDVDQGIVDYIYTGTDCFFDNTKINMNYEFLLGNKKPKINIYYLYETQFYNKYFTEFDLEIRTAKIKYSNYIKNHKYHLSISYSDAVNITLGDLTLSTSYMDRGYYEMSINLMYQFEKMGFSVIFLEREYDSKIIEDQLHLNRAHNDMQYSFWHSFYLFEMKNKLVFKYRERNTLSPYSWVSNLKTFDKFNLEHIIYFKL